MRNCAVSRTSTTAGSAPRSTTAGSCSPTRSPPRRPGPTRFLATLHGPCRAGRAPARSLATPTARRPGSVAADDRQPGLDHGGALDGVDRELVRREAHDLPAAGERALDLVAAHPARTPDSRLAVAEA